MFNAVGSVSSVSSVSSVGTMFDTLGSVSSVSSIGSPHGQFKRLSRHGRPIGRPLGSKNKPKESTKEREKEFIPPTRIEWDCLVKAVKGLRFWLDRMKAVRFLTRDWPIELNRAFAAQCGFDLSRTYGHRF